MLAKAVRSNEEISNLAKCITLFLEEKGQISTILRWCIRDDIKHAGKHLSFLDVKKKYFSLKTGDVLTSRPFKKRLSFLTITTFLLLSFITP
jgi:hypothetical protein